MIIHQRSFVIFVYRTHISFFIRGGQHALIKGKFEEVAKGAEQAPLIVPLIYG